MYTDKKKHISYYSVRLLGTLLASHLLFSCTRLKNQSRVDANDGSVFNKISSTAKSTKRISDIDRISEEINQLPRIYTSSSNRQILSQSYEYEITSNSEVSSDGSEVSSNSEISSDEDSDILSNSEASSDGFDILSNSDASSLTSIDIDDLARQINALPDIRSQHSKNSFIRRLFSPIIRKLFTRSR